LSAAATQAATDNAAPQAVAQARRINEGDTGLGAEKFQRRPSRELAVETARL